MVDIRRADLHTHTRCSDGVLTPAGLVGRAHEVGLQALSVTDHDTIDGVKEARKAGRRQGVEVITGVELSVSVENHEVHLLGYFFDETHEELQAHLESVRQDRRERARDIVEKLNDLGATISYRDVAEQAKGEAVGRPHIAAALVAAGHVDHEQEAFDRYLGAKGAAYVSRERIAGTDAVDLLHRAGGVAVLAHPGHWMPDTTIHTLVEAGLDGIETIHPSHDDMLTRYYTALAKRFNLLRSGGSDFHGRPSEEERLGHFTIPYPRVAKLRQCAQRVREQNASVS